MEENEYITALSNNDLLTKYESALIGYGKRIGAGEDIKDHKRKEMGRLGAEVHARLTTASTGEIETMAHALFDLAVEERNTFFAFHPQTGLAALKFEGLLKARFVKQAAFAIAALGKTVPEKLGV